MKNKIYNIFKIIFFIIFLVSNAQSTDQFIFNITEVEILENGNLFKGLNKGTVKTNDGIIINANTFEYNKSLNILKAKGDVQIEDTINQYSIFSDDITYLKNEEIISTKGNSKVIDHLKNQIINSDILIHDKFKNTFQAKGNAKIEDTIKQYSIFSDIIFYQKNIQKIFTEGPTEANIQSKYNFKSKNVVLLNDKQKLSSKYKTIIKDQNLNVYHLDKFSYLIDKEELKGDNIIIISNFGLPNNEKVYFSNAIINFKKQNSIAKDTKIQIAKNAFGNKNNDPRLYGASSQKNNQKTVIKKGVFKFIMYKYI